MNSDLIDIFIPSYHRPDRLKTVAYFISRGYAPKKIHVVIDDEADDHAEYEAAVNKFGCNLHVFNMQEARRRFDYVHRPNVVRRSAGQARNMFQDIACKLGIFFYTVIDDDTHRFEVRPFCIYKRAATLDEIAYTFNAIRDFMIRHHVGLFGLCQTGDMMAIPYRRLLRRKVMNVSFYNLPFIYRGERAALDDDTSQFVGVLNEGLFTGSLSSGIVLQQTLSATEGGGNTELYEECRLLNKALVTPIQFPSCIRAERQPQNGNRIHHKINYRHLCPPLMCGERSNIAWDTYPEDVPFTNEPKRKYVLHD